MAGRAAALNLEWLKSSFKLLESALRERNKQLEIQKKEIEFLRNELRRKDDVIKEYENLINEREDMERQEVEILHKEIKTLRMDAMSKVVTIREQKSEIERLESKVEKLMSVMPPPSLPRARAQGVSAEPAAKNLNVNFQQFLKHYAKSDRWVSFCFFQYNGKSGNYGRGHCVVLLDKILNFHNSYLH